MSAAVVASFLGVGGTVIGAALGSIVASVGGAVYSHSFKRAGDRLGETKVLTVVTRPRPGAAEPPARATSRSSRTPTATETNRRTPSPAARPRSRPAEPVEVGRSPVRCRRPAGGSRAG